MVHKDDYVCPHCGNKQIEFFRNGEAERKKLKTNRTVCGCRKCDIAEFAEIEE